MMKYKGRTAEQVTGDHMVTASCLMSGNSDGEEPQTEVGGDQSPGGVSQTPGTTFTSSQYIVEIIDKIFFSYIFDVFVLCKYKIIPGLWLCYNEILQISHSKLNQEGLLAKYADVIKTNCHLDKTGPGQMINQSFD